MRRGSFTYVQDKPRIDMRNKTRLGGEVGEGGFEVEVYPAHVEGEDITVVVVRRAVGKAVPAGFVVVKVEGGRVVAVMEGAGGGVALKVGAGFFSEDAEGEV